MMNTFYPYILCSVLEIVNYQFAATSYCTNNLYLLWRNNFFQSYAPGEDKQCYRNPLRIFSMFPALFLFSPLRADFFKVLLKLQLS